MADVDPQVSDLALNALQSAIDGADDVAKALTQRISDEHGGDGLSWAVLAWCDAVWQHHPADGNHLVFVIGGEETDASGVPSETAWAGQLIGARMRMDLDMVGALFSAQPADRVQRGAYVWRVLVMCADTLRAIGDGRMAELMARG